MPVNQTNRVKIRQVTIDDAPVIAELAGQLGYPLEPAEATQRLSALQTDPQQCVLLAEQAGLVTGWAHVFGAPRLIDPPFAELGGLVVRDGYRGQGAGAALVAAAEAWARQQGYAAMRVRSNIARERAPAFYTRQGYHLQKVQNVFYKELPPAAEERGA